MTARIDLVWIGNGEAPSWPSGRVVVADPTPRSVAESLERLSSPASNGLLFWSARLGRPDGRRVEETFARPGDLWHAGLRLGLGGLPGSIDYVAPTWMLNRDPNPAIEATSWRLSLEACLMKSDVPRRVGFLRPEFRTLAAAGLEFGHRSVTYGVLTRHIPSLLAGEPPPGPAPEIPLEDELRFLYERFGAKWTRWAVFRSVLTGRGPARESLALLGRLTRSPRSPQPVPYREGFAAATAARPNGAVTVLIPTVDRYPYLEKLLDQLRRQTVRPLEIVIVDQTAPDRQQPDLAERFADLPIRLLHLDQPGQCSSRNAGIEQARGDFLIFLDDDDEVAPDLIERHLAALDRFGNDVSCGVADEDGAGPLPEAFRRIRTSDVFPTNNSLIRMSALSGSGLFDLAYDRGARADADLGMRLYLAGHLMVLNPEIRVLHRHAPSGGLRTHGARVITYASSRNRLTHRHLPSPTELYLGQRYFSPRQVREGLWHSVLGTFSARGSRARRAAKASLALFLLPHSLWTIRIRRKITAAMLEKYPRIAAWNDPSRAAAGRPGGARQVN
jgi:glycosyltransferase involved in cell wall biosynthesis